MDASTEPPNRRPSPEVVAARQYEIHRRYARKSKARNRGRPRPKNLALIVFAQLNRLWADRYGAGIWPDDDAGKDDIELLVNFAVAARKDPHAQIAVHAPWLPALEAERLISSAHKFPVKYTPLELGRRLRVTSADRNRLKLWNIFPIDATKAETARGREDRRNAGKRHRRAEAKQAQKQQAQLTARQAAVLAAIGDEEIDAPTLIDSLAQHDQFLGVKGLRQRVHECLDRLVKKELVAERLQPSTRASVRYIRRR